MRFRAKNSQKLMLLRRRHNLTHAQMAAQMGMTEEYYREVEEGKHEDRLPFVPIGYMALYEHCYLLRLESELTLDQIAEKMGVIKEHVGLMELGVMDPSPLAAFWEINHE